MYAMNLVPILHIDTHTLNLKPPNTTVNPLEDGKITEDKRKRDSTVSSDFFDLI